jgi:predicted DNA-binding protein (MmcQ/YjbR family)
VKARRHPAEAALRAFALSYPEATEDFPWGHRAIKVRRKAFVFMSNDEPDLSLSVKLPASAEGALQLPFAEPTHYGLGRSGWVTATFGPRAKPPLDVLRSWIDESYRAVAPKRLAATLPGEAAAPARAAGRRRRG